MAINRNSWKSDNALFDEAISRLESNSFPLKYSTRIDTTLVNDYVKNTKDEPETLTDFREGIVLPFVRPVLLITNNSFEPPTSEVLKERLSKAKDNIEACIKATGRVEIRNHLRKDWVGTAWLVAKDIVATNSHVAKEFVRRDGESFVFRQNPITNKIMQGKIDFREEYKQPEEAEFFITQVLYLNDGDDPDLALLRVSTASTYGGELSDPIPLFQGPSNLRDQVAVIGYPHEDGQRNPIPIMDEIFKGIYNVKRLAPGEITGVTREAVTHDCTTLGGNSGSVLFDYNKGVAVGLHFGGISFRENLAVPSAGILEHLKKIS